MSEAFPICLASVLRAEGGYTNNAADPAGATNRGITWRVYDAYRRSRGLEPRDVRLMTDDECAEIYRESYWAPIMGDAMPPALALCVFHAAVNSGPYNGAYPLQKIVGAVADGKIGPNTLKAVQAYASSHGLATLIRQFQNARRDFYRGLKGFPTFGKGWLARTDAVETEALKLIPFQRGA